MELCAIQSIEERVARGVVFDRRRLDASVVDGKMARQSKLGRNRRDLALAVRLHDAA